MIETLPDITCLRRPLIAVLGLAFLVASATAATAANLTDLRIGVHGDHTRIVLETDAAAPYVVDTNDREVVVHVDAAAAAEAVTAKSPHLIWAKVEPTAIGADVRLQLKQPADVKAMVLTGPHRIVLDLYPRKVAAKAPPATEPLPAPELLPEPEEPPAPPVTAEAEPGLPEEETEVPGPTPEELAAVDAELAEEMAAAEAPAPEAQPEPAAEEAPAPATATGEPTAPAPTEAQAPEATAGVETGREIRVPLPSPDRPARPAAPEPPSGGLFGSPLLLAATAVVLFGLFLFLRRRLRARPGTERFTYPEEPAEAPPAFELPRAVPVESPPSGVGESLFDVDAEALDAIPKDEERMPRVEPAHADAGDETQRRIAHLERRIEELVDARERLERQVAAQTEELRVQRAAIARTQRVLRSVAPRNDDEASEPVIRG